MTCCQHHRYSLYIKMEYKYDEAGDELLSLVACNWMTKYCNLLITAASYLDYRYEDPYKISAQGFFLDITLPTGSYFLQRYHRHNTNQLNSIKKETS